jgi:hypothetical protein
MSLSMTALSHRRSASAGLSAVVTDTTKVTLRTHGSRLKKTTNSGSGASACCITQQRSLVQLPTAISTVWGLASVRQCGRDYVSKRQSRAKLTELANIVSPIAALLSVERTTSSLHRDCSDIRSPAFSVLPVHFI